MAGRSQVQVINLALIALGKPQIVDIDEDSEEAQKASTIYTLAVQNELRLYSWSFAIGRALLPATTIATPGTAWDYTYAFQLPSDYLRIIQINDFWLFPSIREATGESSQLYKIEGSQILTSLAAPLKLRYIKDYSGNPAVWDSAFTRIMASRLAWELALTLTGSETIMTAMQKRYSAEVAVARRTGALELAPEAVTDGSWIESRFA